MIEHTNGDPIEILLVEDNPGDVRLTREAFEEGRINNTLNVVRDGEAALDYLHQRAPHGDATVPDLVLLDLNLPKVDGMEVLEEIKSHERLRRLPVIILTGSEAQEDVVKGYERQSNAYLTKPVDADEFVELVRSFEEFWFTVVQLPPTPDEE